MVYYLVDAKLLGDCNITWYILHYLVDITLPGRYHIIWLLFYNMVDVTLLGDCYITWWVLHYLVDRRKSQALLLSGELNWLINFSLSWAEVLPSSPGVTRVIVMKSRTHDIFIQANGFILKSQPIPVFCVLLLSYFIRNFQVKTDFALTVISIALISKGTFSQLITQTYWSSFGSCTSSRSCRAAGLYAYTETPPRDLEWTDSGCNEGKTQTLTQSKLIMADY